MDFGNRTFAWLNLVNYILLCFALIVALTWVNNTWFYEAKDISVKEFQGHYLSLLDEMFSQCLKQNTSDLCEQQLTQVIQQAKPKGVLTLTRAGQPVEILNNQYYSDQRSIVTTDRTLGQSPDLLTLTYAQHSSPVIWLSVVRSITFSAADHWEKWNDADYWDFVLNIAIPRSRPFWFFCGLIICTAVLNFLRFRELRSLYENAKVTEHRLVEKLQRVQAEANAAFESNETLSHALKEHSSTIEKTTMELMQKQQELHEWQAKNPQTDTVAAGEQSKDDKPHLVIDNSQQKHAKALSHEIHRLKTKLENAGEETAKLIQARNSAQHELDNKRAYVAELKKQLEAAEKRTSKLEPKAGDDVGWRKKLFKAFLHNPKVQTASKQTKVNSGRHHSSDFVALVAEAIASYPELSAIAESVTSIAYNPKKRGQADVTVDGKKNRFVLNIYDDGDEGFGAQILLSAQKEWEAIIEAKCLIETVSRFKHLTLNDRLAV